MMTEIISYALDLSNEEVWALLHILQLPDLPGWKRPQIAEDRNETAQAVLRTAEGSLKARNLLQITVEDPRDKLAYHVDRTTAALIGAGILAKKVLVLTHQSEPDVAETRHMYFAPDLTVLHMKPEIGTQRFVVINGGEMLLSAIAEALDLQIDTASRPAEDGITLSREQLQKARQFAQNEQISAYKTYLSQIGIAEDASHQLLPALMSTNPIGRILVADAGKDQVQAMVVIYTDDGYWLTQENGEDVSIIPAHSADVTGHIVDMLDY